jgi:hypothetical protein
VACLKTDYSPKLQGYEMTTHTPRHTRKTLILLGITAAAFAAGCSTDSASKKSSSAAAAPSDEVGHLSAADARKDPDRIICRRHKPTGSRISEKICMTARQWQNAREASDRYLDRAQRAPQAGADQ